MGIQSAGSLHTMKFFIVAALCAVSMAAPEGRRLRPEEHWRPAQGRDLSKYKPRGAMVDANGDDLMVKINKVAAEMRATASPSNHKDAGKPKAAVALRAPPAREGLLVVLRLLGTPGLGRWLSSSMTPGSAVVPSSLRTMS